MLHRTASRGLLAGFALVGIAACNARSPDADSGASGGPLAEVVYLGQGALSDTRSMDIYVEGTAIHALVSGTTGSVMAGTARVHYLRSEDGGRTWSNPVVVSTGKAPAARRGNDVQIAVAGATLVAVWPVAGALPGLAQIAIAFSLDRGRSWQAGTRPGSGPEHVDEGYMDLAADQAGGFHLVWLDDRDETGRHAGVRYSSSVDGRRWSPVATLDPSSCTCCWLSLVSSGERALGVLYRDDEPHDMALLRSIDGRWARAGSVGAFGWDFRGCPHAGGALTVTGEASARHLPVMLHAVVWTGREPGTGLYYLRSTDGGRRWGLPHRLGDARARHGDIAALAGNHLVAAWEQAWPEGSRILISESRDGGAHWSDPIPLSGGRSEAQYPRVVATPLGARVFWTEAGAGARWAMARPPAPSRGEEVATR